MSGHVMHGIEQIKAIVGDRWLRYVIGCVLGVGSIAGVWYGYRVYTTHKNEVAQRVFSEVFEEYERALAGIDEAWSNVETLATFAYEQHASTVFGPYILALKGEAVAHRGAHDEALAMFNQVIEQTRTSPLHLYYQTKAAIMKLDSSDKAVQEAGLNGLRAIAQDKNNPDQSRARYYLGAYYKAQGDEQAARNTWQALANEARVDSGDSLAVWGSFALSQLQ